MTEAHHDFVPGPVDATQKLEETHGWVGNCASRCHMDGTLLLLGHEYTTHICVHIHIHIYIILYMILYIIHYNIV